MCVIPKLERIDYRSCEIPQPARKLGQRNMNILHRNSASIELWLAVRIDEPSEHQTYGTLGPYQTMPCLTTIIV
jgi:hypothetical protein